MNPLRELPKLDPTRCTRSGDCVKICPVDCLEIKGPIPWLARPVDCIACQMCEMTCPTEAILVVAIAPA